MRVKSACLGCCNSAEIISRIYCPRYVYWRVHRIEDPLSVFAKNWLLIIVNVVLVYLIYVSSLPVKVLNSGCFLSWLTLSGLRCQDVSLIKLIVFIFLLLSLTAVNERLIDS